MKSVKLTNGKVGIVEVKKPALTGFGAIVKVEGCGLCGSDIVKIREGAEDAVLGHEVVGEIVEIHSNTDFKRGDKVVVAHHYPCFECEFCKNESFSMCKTFKETNITPGGFSEYILITEGHLKNTVFKLPKGFDPVAASFCEPLACCLRAIRRANLRYVSLANKDESVLSIGLGSIGILMAQAARNFGYNSYGFDVNLERQKFALEYGIEFNPDVKYDAIFMTSGSAKAMPTALALVRDGGKIIVFSSVEAQAAYQNNEIYYRELSVIGSYSPAPIDLKNSHSKIINSAIKVEKISQIYDLEDIQNAIDDTISGNIHKAYIKCTGRM